jgi:hypothetical protein
VKRIHLVVGLGALVSACAAPMRWVKPDAGPAQLEADTQDCRGRAWLEANRYSSSVMPWHYRMGFRSSPLADPFFEESRLAAYCMEIKGYRLEEANPR